MYKTDNCTLTSIVVLLGLNLITFCTFTIFLISNSLNPIYQTKAPIVSSKRANIEGYMVTNLRSTSHDKCPESYRPLFKNLTTGPTLGYCRKKTDNSTKFQSIDNASNLKIGKIDDSLCKSGFSHIPGTSGLQLPKLESKLICAKFVKAEKLGYEVSETRNCQEGMHVCGKLTENSFCINNQFECPINGFRIQEGLSSFPGREKYQRIELGNNKFLYFTKTNTDGYVLTDDWILGNPKGVCLNPNEIVSSKRVWEFWKQDYVQYCRSALINLDYDKDYTLIYKTNWKTLLQNNEFNAFIQKNNLDLQMGQIDDREIGIFHKSKIYFNEECKDYHSTYDQTFLNFGSAVDYENIFILLTISVVLNSCAIILLFVQLLIGCLLKKGKLVRNYTINWKMLVKSLSSVALFNIIMITLLIVSLVLIKRNENHVYLDAKRRGFSCVDKSLTLFIDFFLNKDNAISNIIILTLSFGIISSFSYIIFYLIIIKNFDKNLNMRNTSNNLRSKIQSANSKSEENIQKISKTTSSTKSKYSQKSRDETYNSYTGKFFSGYNSMANLTWQTFQASGIQNNISKNNDPKTDEKKLKNYVFIDENDEPFETDKETSYGNITDPQMGYSQFLKKDEIRKSETKYKSNSLSDISKSQEFKYLQNEETDFFPNSKYSSGDNQSQSFGILKDCIISMKKKNSSKRFYENHIDSGNNDSFASNNTSINNANMNFITNKILNFTKEEIVYKSGSIGEEKIRKSSRDSI